MGVEYVDILTGKNLSSIYVIYWLVGASRRRGGDGVKEVDGG